MFVGPLCQTIDLWKNLKRRECPQDYMVERPAQSREARVRFPVPRKRNSSENCLATDCRAASRMILNGECRWEYIGNQRIRIPPDQPQGRLRILTNPCRHSENFATNAGVTTY